MPHAFRLLVQISRRCTCEDRSPYLTGGLAGPPSASEPSPASESEAESVKYSNSPSTAVARSDAPALADVYRFRNERSDWNPGALVGILKKGFVYILRREAEQAECEGRQLGNLVAVRTGWMYGFFSTCSGSVRYEFEVNPTAGSILDVETVRSDVENEEEIASGDTTPD